MLEMDTQRNWFALIPTWGCDNELASELSVAGIRAFSPLHTKYRKVSAHRRRKIGKSKELIVTELTPGYVFACITCDDDLVAVERCKSFNSFIAFGEFIPGIRTKDMVDFLDVVDKGTYDEVEPKQGPSKAPSVQRYSDKELLAYLGTNVRVTTGSFAGATGVIKEVRGSRLLLDSLIKMEVDPEMISVVTECQDPVHL